MRMNMHAGTHRQMQQLPVKYTRMLKRPMQYQKMRMKRPQNRDRADNLEQTAALWYEKEGKERLCAICKKAAQEGKNSISIGKEGICTIPSKGSYQRIGFLKGFPKGQQESLIQVFKRDGFLVRTSGNYLRLYWKRGEFQ